MLNFKVFGKTATKGSTRSFVQRGRVVTLADNRNLGAWTQAAKWAATEAGAVVIAKPGAVCVIVTCVFVRPKSVTTRRQHTVKPDIDKLLRAVLDALTGIAYEDDAQVMSVAVHKTYGEQEFCAVAVYPGP